MLAVSMAPRPPTLMLDELRTGLAPVIAQDMFRGLLEMNRSTGTAIVLKTYGIIFDGDSADLARHEDLWRWF